MDTLNMKNNKSCNVFIHSTFISSIIEDSKYRIQTNQHISIQINTNQYKSIQININQYKSTQINTNQYKSEQCSNQMYAYKLES